MQKESDSLNQVTKPPVNQPSVASLGSVVDVGPINADTRIMKMDLKSQNYTLYGSNEEVSYVFSKG